MTDQTAGAPAGAAALLTDGARAALLDRLLACCVEQGTREVRPGASLRVRRHAPAAEQGGHAARGRPARCAPWRGHRGSRR